MLEPQEFPCPVCAADDARVFFELPGIPVFANVLCDDRLTALTAPRGDMRLAFCDCCGHLFNAAFEPERMNYNARYENSLHYSPSFQHYADGLAERLVTRYDLRGKDIIEIGSGRGDFLRALCRLGCNRGAGFDPGYPGDVTLDPGEAVTFETEPFSERHAQHPADLIVARHVLEHIAAPREFLAMIRRAVGRRSPALFFEVPNARFTLSELSVWDLIYEHVSYFTAESLAYLFAASGFAVQAVEPAFGGQYLALDACPAGDPATQPPLPDTQSLAVDVQSFVSRFQAKLADWQGRLQAARAAGREVVVWGSGSKGVTFLNLLPDRDLVRAIVDINPRKHGKFVAGSGQEIIPPERLRDLRPQVVVVMNPIYAAEIRDMLSNLGLSAEILVA
jgi:hypothetical protein